MPPFTLDADAATPLRFRRLIAPPAITRVIDADAAAFSPAAGCFARRHAASLRMHALRLAALIRAYAAAAFTRYCCFSLRTRARQARRAAL